MKRKGKQHSAASLFLFSSRPHPAGFFSGAEKKNFRGSEFKLRGSEKIFGGSEFFFGGSENF